jgi:hypothetical protein
MGISKGRIFLKKASSRDLNVVRKTDPAMRMPVENKPGRRPSPPANKGKSGEAAPEWVRVPVQLTRAQALRLKAAAEERGTTVGELVRAAIEHYLAGIAVPKSGTPSLTREELENLFKDR